MYSYKLSLGSQPDCVLFLSLLWWWPSRQSICFISEKYQQTKREETSEVWARLTDLWPIGDTAIPQASLEIQPTYSKGGFVQTSKFEWSKLFLVKINARGK